MNCTLIASPNLTPFDDLITLVNSVIPAPLIMSGFKGGGAWAGFLAVLFAVVLYWRMTVGVPVPFRVIGSAFAYTFINLNIFLIAVYFGDRSNGEVLLSRHWGSDVFLVIPVVCIVLWPRKSGRANSR